MTETTEPKPERADNPPRIKVDQRIGAITGGKVVGVELHQVEHVVIEVGQAAAPPEPGDPPYKGLQAYDVADAPIFFGREKLTAELVSFLRDHTFLAVVGASGSGKSSLVRAGVAAALQAGKPLEGGVVPPLGSSQWPTIIVTPTATPLEALARALAGDGDKARKLMEDMANDAGALRDFLAGELGATGQRYLLVVDQFEELAQCRNQDERRAYIDNLLAAAGLPADQAGEAAQPPPQPGATVVLTLRADFYDACGRYEGLRQALETHQAFIGAMNRAELQRTIELPAERGQWAFQQGLVEQILEDVGNEPGALPLLSHALLETWRRRSGRVMTLAGYRDAGGLRNAIAKTAQQVYDGLSPAEQNIARRMFLSLIDPGETELATRRREARASLVLGPGDETPEARVLSALSGPNARLLTTDEDTVQIAHEALIRAWPTLSQWLVTYRSDLRLLESIRDAAAAWSEADQARNEDALAHRGGRLDDALKLREDGEFPLGQRERAYLDACVALRAREAALRERGRRRLTISLVLGFCVVSLLAGLAGAQWRRAEGLLSVALSRGLALGGSSLLDSHTDAALLLGVQANRYNDTPQSRDALLASLQRCSDELIRFGRGHVDRVWDVAFSPDGRLLASTGDDGQVLLWQVPGLGRAGALPPGTSRGNRYAVAFSPDGGLLAAATGAGQVQLWDTATLTVTQALQGHQGGVYALAFSPDGRYLASGGADRRAVVWDLGTSEPKAVCETNNWVWDVAWSADGRMMASASKDGVVRVLDMERPLSPTAVLTRTNEAIGFTSVAFSRSMDKLLLAAGDSSGYVVVWDLTEWPQEPTRVVQQRPFYGTVWGLAFSPTEDDVLAGSSDRSASITRGKSQIFRVDGAGGKLEPLTLGEVGHTGGLFRIAFSPQGDLLAVAGQDNLVSLWSARESPNILRLKGPRDFAVEPEGETLVALDATGAASTWRAGQPVTKTQTVEMWESTPLGAAAISAGGAYAAMAERSSAVIRLAEPGASAPPSDLAGHSAEVTRLRFSPDGALLASTDISGTLILWDTATHKESCRLQLPHYPVKSLAFTPDGAVLAVAGCRTPACGAGSVFLLNTQDCSAIAPLPPWRWGAAISVAASAQVVAFGSVDSLILVWDLQRATEQSTIRRSNADVLALALSPDGQLLAAAYDDRRVILYRLATGEPLGEAFQDHDANVTALAFSADGRWLFSASAEDNTIIANDLGPQSWQERACRIANRNLSQEEWRKYVGDMRYTSTCPQFPAGQ